MTFSFFYKLTYLSLTKLMPAERRSRETRFGCGSFVCFRYYSLPSLCVFSRPRTSLPPTSMPLCVHEEGARLAPHCSARWAWAVVCSHALLQQYLGIVWRLSEHGARLLVKDATHVVPEPSHPALFIRFRSISEELWCGVYIGSLTNKQDANRQQRLAPPHLTLPQPRPAAQHRDLKLENILIEMGGKEGSAATPAIKLVDFGLSAIYQENGVSTDVLGSWVRWFFCNGLSKDRSIFRFLPPFNTWSPSHALSPP